MTEHVRKFKRLLVANRGEVAIRVLRAAAELKIRTVALYTYEDRYSLHRYKADEAYQIGSNDNPLKPYLDIDEIISLAKRRRVDAIHPGYGFLSENVEFADRCEEAGIVFVGPRSEVMRQLGDKIQAKTVARRVGVPVIEDGSADPEEIAQSLRNAERIGYPVIIKAAAGGGGRGMRVVRKPEELPALLHEAAQEAARAFGDSTVFLERYLEAPKHIEVQLIADNYGNILHLYERDCSVQRRHQKVVEVAPCMSLQPHIRERLCEYAVRIGRAVSYNNVGTIEFLVEGEDVFFIEVNPRIQVEHTITEEITGIDLVRSQILIAEGNSLASPRIYLKSQEDVVCHGYAIQCRITTEDPLDDFRPDYGTIIAYRTPGGFGIRLDSGSAYSGAVISPFFDSLLVKVTAWGRTLTGASERLQRALQEFRIRGVKTNVAFLENVITHRDFRKARTTVRFIQERPELFQFKPPRNRANRILQYLGEVTVNGNPDVKCSQRGRRYRALEIPPVDRHAEPPAGTKQRLTELGPERFVEWLKNEQAIQYTDTTMRDAHQSLLATRVRTLDMMRIARSFAVHHPEVFSMEVWGGATFDVALRFLHECPWNRLKLLREAVPNILLQMLLRGSNGVGYSSYPDNVIVSFIEQSWRTGIDLFRVFDSMNWLPNMEVSIRAIRERTGALAEAAICYTGDILDAKRTKFTLTYYLDLARRLEDMGAHMLAIKDMAGLLKPYAAEMLVSELKRAVALPIHLHTHDTSSIQAATYMKAIEAGVDVVDVALASMSGLTSQPNFNSLVATMQDHPRKLPVNLSSLNAFSRYWETVREYYEPFETELRAGTAEVYEHEIPGGQYSNLRPQARALGLEDKFEEIKRNYIVANDLLGDVVKVTPSSKVVGDLALFMTSNGLQREDIVERAETLSFPESLRSFFRGDMGQPYGGFPEALQRAVLRGEQPLAGRPNDAMPPCDLEREFEAFREKFGADASYVDFLSWMLYPKVFADFDEHRRRYGEVWLIPTPSFLYGMEPNEEILVDIADGKTLIVKMLYVGEADERGVRTVSFRLNGGTRGIEVRDTSVSSKQAPNRKVSAPNEVGSPLRGRLFKVLVSEGEAVETGVSLFVIEAMKMETTVSAPASGVIKKIHLRDGSMVDQDDLVLEME